MGGDLSGAGSSKCVTERVIDGELRERVVGRSREKIVGIVSKLLPISYRRATAYTRARERERGVVSRVRCNLYGHMRDDLFFLLLDP
jgi:hypothetical protein